MKKQKWYLNSWLIAVLIFLWPTIIAPIIGIILLIMQTVDNKKRFEEYSKAINGYNNS